MFSVPFLVIFGTIKNFFVGLLSNPKVLVLLVVLAFVGIGVYKYDKVNDEVLKTQKALNESESDNSTLRDTVSRLDAESNAKDTTIKFMAEQNKQQLELIDSLKKKNQKVEKDVEALKRALGDIKTPPTADVGPYLKKALQNVKTLREQQ